MKFENEAWTDPVVPSFISPDFENNCPVFSTSGDTLYYISTQPEGFIFRTTKVDGEWTDPVALAIPIPAGSELGWQFTINTNRDIYFENWNDLYCSKFENGSYQFPQMLSTNINTDNFEFSPYISPDDRFLLFSSDRPGGFGFTDLYISQKNNLGVWTDPVNMGPEINSTSDDAFPFISYDNLYFFFTTLHTGDLGYNPYWADANMIYSLVTNVNENKIPEENFIITNYPNPFNPETTITFKSARLYDDIQIEIFNIKGQRIRNFKIIEKGENKNSIVWDGENEKGVLVSSGIYFCRLTVDHCVIDSHKMILMK